MCLDSPYEKLIWEINQNEDGNPQIIQASVGAMPNPADTSPHKYIRMDNGRPDQYNVALSCRVDWRKGCRLR